MDRYDNTAQYSWFLDIARTFLGFTGDRITAADADPLFDAAEKTFAQKDWERQVFAKTKLEKIFLTNEFDDPLDGLRHDEVRALPADGHAGVPHDRAGNPGAAGEGDGRLKSATCGGMRKAIRVAVRALHGEGGEGLRHLAAAGLQPAQCDDEYFYEQIHYHDATTSPRACSGCWRRTAASSACPST